MSVATLSTPSVTELADSAEAVASAVGAPEVAAGIAALACIAENPALEAAAVSLADHVNTAAQAAARANEGRLYAIINRIRTEFDSLNAHLITEAATLEHNAHAAAAALVSHFQRKI